MGGRPACMRPTAPRSSSEAGRSRGAICPRFGGATRAAGGATAAHRALRLAPLRIAPRTASPSLPPPACAREKGVVGAVHHDAAREISKRLQRKSHDSVSHWRGCGVCGSRGGRGSCLYRRRRARVSVWSWAAPAPSHAARWALRRERSARRGAAGHRCVQCPPRADPAARRAPAAGGRNVPKACACRLRSSSLQRRRRRDGARPLARRLRSSPRCPPC